MPVISSDYNVLVFLMSTLQAEHKIQSASGPLNMQLAQVPKMLAVLKRDWVPLAFCVSFKVRYSPPLFHFQFYLTDFNHKS